jgi:hypothetical protein
MMSVKTIWYELSPYLYAATGVATIFNRGSWIGLLCGAILVAVSASILTLRWAHRHNLVAPARRRA